MNIDINNFNSYNKDLFDLVVRPKNFDVSGGKITKDEIDIIKNYPNAKSLEISGLNQETFEYFIKNYGKQFVAISFFKNKLVNNLEILNTLTNIEYIHYFYNQKVEALWNMDNNKKLKGLSLMDFKKLNNINGIEKATNLILFEIGNEAGASKESEIESLKPIVNSNITNLSLYCNVKDNDYMLLSKSKINKLDMNPTRFTLEELAKLVSSIPNLKGKVTIPYIKMGFRENNRTTYCYFLCKGRKRLIQGDKDFEIKLNEYINEYNELLNKFRKQ